MRSDYIRTFWGKVKQQRKSIFVILPGLLGLALLFIIIAGYVFRWSWTGLIPSVGPQVQQYQPGKTLWDWMQLLIVPAALAIFVYWYNRRDQNEARQRALIERERLLDSQRQATLQAYIDRMSDVLLGKELDELKAIPGFFTVVRARTLSTLKNLDPDRKTSVFEFLYGAGLFPYIYLDDADLSGANLSGANLREAKLRKTNLCEANLHGVTLDKAELFDACLRGANLERANLVEARLTGADLTHANLKDTNLSKADLRGATYTKEQIDQIKWKDDIIL